MNVSLSAAELTRYSRHLALSEIGTKGQARLKAARVALIGVGGLGSPAALYLAASGVGQMGLIDADRVELSNLQRQVIYTVADIGRSKVDTARERLLALNPEIEVTAYEVELRAANVMEILSDYDIVLDGTDRFASRYLASDACVLLRKPLVSAAVHRFEGQLFTYVPDGGPCYRCLFPEPPAAEWVPNCAEAGVLGVLPGVLGTIQATEAIKLIVAAGDPLTGRLLNYDALDMRFTELRFERRADCAICGSQPTLTAPSDAPEISADILARIRSLSAHELATLLEHGAADPITLIDVREPDEFRTQHLRGAINIPVATLPSRLAELDPARASCFICRSGARSLTACTLAARGGMQHVGHLEGGLLAWAAQIDRAFQVAMPVG